MQVLLAVFYPVILLVLAVRAVTSPLFLWVEYNRPGFPGDGYGFSTDDRMTYGSYAVDYLSNWSGPRYLGELVNRSGDKLFKDGEVSHMADVKLVILSTFGAGALLILLSLVAVIYLRRRGTGGVRRGLFAGSIITLVDHHRPRSARRPGLGAVLHRIPPHLLRQRHLDLLPAGHADPAVPGPVLGGCRDRDRGPGPARIPRHPDPDVADPQAPRPGQGCRRKEGAKESRKDADADADADRGGPASLARERPAHDAGAVPLLTDPASTARTPTTDAARGHSERTCFPKLRARPWPGARHVLPGA